VKAPSMEAKDILNLLLSLNPMRLDRVDAIGKLYRKPAVEPNRTTGPPLNPAAKGKPNIISTMYNYLGFNMLVYVFICSSSQSARFMGLINH